MGKRRASLKVNNFGKMDNNTGKVTGNESGKREIHPYVRPGICTILNRDQKISTTPNLKIILIMAKN